MMTNYANDLDSIACRLDEAKKLLMCFAEFWQVEGYIPPDATQEKVRLYSENYTRRSEQYIVLVTTAISTLIDNQKELEEITDKMFQELRQEHSSPQVGKTT